MKAVIGLLLMLVRVSLGVETFCDGRQDKAQCYGAVGGTVVIQLMDNIPENQRFTWSHSRQQIVRQLGNGTVINNLSHRLQIISKNGKLRMDNLIRTDDGEYKLETFNKEEVRTSLRTQQLNIQAPVSSVQLIPECLSQGEKRMSCFSDGDSPQFSWTLNGDTLTDDQLLSGNNETNEITLKPTVSGELVCTARNQVNKASVSGVIPTCAVITFIDGQQRKAQFYGALGGTVVIQLMENTPKTLKFAWSNSKGPIVRRIRNRPVTKILKRSEFTSNNGTVRINDLIRTDDGEYKLETYNEDGVRTAVWTLQLNIQAPVSSVQLMPECLSQGVKRMSCFSDGDSPQFSWTLDGDTLTDDQLLSGNNETNEITLKPTVSGELVCTARNHISNASGTETIPTCGYIFIECQLSNGTNIRQWVFAANNTLCNDPTTATTITTTPTITSDIVGKKSDITVSNNSSTLFTSSNQTSLTTDSCYIDEVLLTLLLRALVVITIFTGILIYFTWKKKKNCEITTGSVIHHRMEHEHNSVLMVEMRKD